jgi:NAD(P)-dependent dehydrogenase (short-subunit alcohol dehydrogenase family)
MNNNKGKIALITGATGGTFEVAKRLGNDGCLIYLSGIDNEAGVEGLKNLQKAVFMQNEYYHFDVTNEE